MTISYMLIHVLLIVHMFNLIGIVMKKINFILLAMMGLVVLFSSCSADSELNRVNIDSPIVKTWSLDYKYDWISSSEYALVSNPINIYLKKKDRVELEDFTLNLGNSNISLYEVQEVTGKYLSDVFMFLVNTISFRNNGKVAVLTKPLGDSSNDIMNWLQVPVVYANYSLYAQNQLAIKIDAQAIIENAYIMRQNVKDVLLKVFSKSLIVNYKLEDNKLKLSFETEFLKAKLKEVLEVIETYPDPHLINAPEISNILDQVPRILDQLEVFEIDLRLKTSIYN